MADWSDIGNPLYQACLEFIEIGMDRDYPADSPERRFFDSVVAAVQRYEKGISDGGAGVGLTQEPLQR